MILCSLWSTIHSYTLKQSFLRPYATTTLCQQKLPGSKISSQFPKQSTLHCGPSSPCCPGQAPGLACSRHCSLSRAGAAPLLTPDTQASSGLVPLTSLQFHYFLKHQLMLKATSTFQLMSSFVSFRISSSPILDPSRYLVTSL